MESLTVIRSRKLAGPASLANILKTVDNIFANRCSQRLERQIHMEEDLNQPSKTIAGKLMTHSQVY